MDKNKKKRIFDPKWDNKNKMVAQIMMPMEGGTMNLAGKLIERAGLLALFHMNLFGNTHNLVMGVDFTPMIDNPQHGKDVESWNKYLNYIIEKEAECEYILQLMEKNGDAKIIDEDEDRNYDKDIFAHTETIGRWRFNTAEKKRKNLEKRA